jgi:hypothetical protein
MWRKIKREINFLVATAELISAALLTPLNHR